MPSGFGFGDQQISQLTKHRSSTEQSFNIYYQNARGLRTKLNLFQNNMDSSSADFFAVTETGCNESIHDAEIVPPGYQIIRCDRTDGRKHGGAFFVATHRFELRRIELPSDVNINIRMFEIVGVAVYLKNKFLFLCCVIYIPPSSPETEYMILFSIIENWCAKYQSVIIIGDFNLYSSNENVVNYFECFLAFCEIVQMNKVPNCNDRQLDLVLCSSNMRTRVEVRAADEELVPVDAHHPPLALRLSRAACAGAGPALARPRASSHSQRHELSPSYNFAKADFSALYALVSNVDWSPLYDMREPETAINYFYETFNAIICDCVPQKKSDVDSSLRYKYPDWFSLDIIRAIRLKAKSHKKYKSSKSSEDYNIFSDCRARVKAMIAQAHTLHLKKVENNLAKDPKSFWSYVRSKKGTVNSKKITKNEKILSVSDCASEFAKFFHSVYGIDTPRLDAKAAAAGAAASAATVSLPRLTRPEVRAALARLKPKRSAGPDGIPAFVVKDCSFILEEPLHHIYNLCLDASYFPDRWKITRVIPIPKSDTGSDVSGFRPVAILSTPAKVFESAVQRSVQQQVRVQLADAQHGFRPARSTTSNLLEAMAYITPHVDAGVQVDVAYFDYKKAFDLVDNDVLLSNMADIGCTCKLLTFFASSLRDRKQYVEYAGCKSEAYVTKTGVSQGSNLGPLEFIIMINKLPEVVQDARCLLFADDLKLLLAVRDENDCHSLQKDISRVVEWSKNNKLQFNISKCSVLSFSRAKNPLHFDYTVDGESLKRVVAVKDLGVNINSELSFRNHIVLVCKKAFRTLGFVLRQAAGFNNIKAISTLYNALIRSQLEFNSAIWAPHEAKYALMLERIQNKFTRFLYLRLYGIYPYYPLMYPTLFVLGMVGYNKLEVRRSVALAYYMMRVFRGVLSNSAVLGVMGVCVPDGYVARRRRPRLFAVPRARTNLLAKSPMVRTLHALNRVAETIDVFICSIAEFKRAMLYDACYKDVN